MEGECLTALSWGQWSRHSQGQAPHNSKFRRRSQGFKRLTIYELLHIVSKATMYHDANG